MDAVPVVLHGRFGLDSGVPHLAWRALAGLGLIQAINIEHSTLNIEHRMPLPGFYWVFGVEC
jgi:hypothetical protein